LFYNSSSTQNYVTFTGTFRRFTIASEMKDDVSANSSSVSRTLQSKGSSSSTGPSVEKLTILKFNKLSILSNYKLLVMVMHCSELYTSDSEKVFASRCDAVFLELTAGRVEFRFLFCLHRTCNAVCRCTVVRFDLSSFLYFLVVFTPSCHLQLVSLFNLMQLPDEINFYTLLLYRSALHSVCQLVDLNSKIFP
jgi:hypothetical protein